MKTLAAKLTICHGGAYNALNVKETVKWLESCIKHLKKNHKDYADFFTANRYFLDTERVGPDEEEIRNPRPTDVHPGRDPFPPR